MLRSMDFIKLFLVLLLSMTLSYIINKLLIKFLSKKQVYQSVREEMINKSSKATTPVGGGLAIVFSFLLSLIIIDHQVFLNHDVFLITILSFCFFCIGFIDDLMKIIKKNSAGIPPLFRSVLEIIIAFIFLYFASYKNELTWFYNLPNNNTLYIGGLFLILTPLIIYGGSNAVNLTDGMDGLLGYLFLFSLLPCLFKTLIDNNHELSLMIIALYGSVFSFIRFNLHPAKIFMGDEGSLFLGSFLIMLSFVLKIEYLLPLTGLIYCIEAISVIIQVFWFQTRGKRVFLMTPLHHHFEMKGVKEWKVVLVFTLIGFITSILSLLIMI